MIRITAQIIRETQKLGGYQFDGVLREESKEASIKLSVKVNADDKKME